MSGAGALRLAAVLCGASSLLSQPCAAEEKPLWEFGLGVGTLAFPDYRGSDEMRMYPVPMPYFIYRGPILKADRGGVRGELFDREHVELSLSMNASVPVNSADNDARRGMPDLRPIVELGPSLDLHLWRSADGASRLDLVLPLRAPVTLETSPQLLGWSFSPRVNLDVQDIGGEGGWNFGTGVGPLFASERFHDYYYSVAPRWASAERPEYHARGGYSGTHVIASLSKRFPAYWVGAFMRYDALAGARFDSSPLMRRKHSLFGGIGIAWMIGESKRLVSSED